MWDTRKVQYLSAPPKAPLPKLQGGLFPIIHLFSPPFEVEIHGVTIHLLLEGPKNPPGSD